VTAAMPHGGTAPPSLPIPVLVDAAPPVETRHVVTPVDRDGRLADRSLLTFLGWPAGMAIAVTIEPGSIVTALRSRDSHRSTRSPPPDRVLPAADQHAGELLIIPGGVVTRMIEAYRHTTGQEGAP